MALAAAISASVRERSIVCGSKSGAADDDDGDGDGDATAAIDSIPNDDWSFRSSIRGRGDLYHRKAKLAVAAPASA